jgi:hypothetical protein
LPEIISIQYLNVFTRHLLNLGSVPLIINKLGGAQLIPLWYKASSKRRGIPVQTIPNQAAAT